MLLASLSRKKSTGWLLRCCLCACGYIRAPLLSFRTSLQRLLHHPAHTRSQQVKHLLCTARRCTDMLCTQKLCTVNTSHLCKTHGHVMPLVRISVDLGFMFMQHLPYHPAHSSRCQVTRCRPFCALCCNQAM